MRDLYRRAHDAEERRAVLCVGALCMLATLTFAAGIVIRPTPLTATILFAM